MNNCLAGTGPVVRSGAGAGMNICSGYESEVGAKERPRSAFRGGPKQLVEMKMQQLKPLNAVVDSSRKEDPSQYDGMHHRPIDSTREVAGCVRGCSTTHH